MNVMNLADPDLELIDPTPNVHALFLQFDKTFFWAKLASRAVVRWSKKMYSCAGICSYDRGGLCDIALSEPLLKLRPRKDLIETLLHEMIHAFLFITCRDQDRDGHGPNFKVHMFRINKAAGLNISIYHDFHDEVKLYQTHWWRCDGPCQSLRPHFGIVRRSANRAPGPNDYWWKDHQRKCGGNFIKIKEPEPKGKSKKENKTNKGNITKYITVNNKTITIDKPTVKDSNLLTPVLKDSNLIKPRLSNSNLVVSKKNNIIFNPQIPKVTDRDRVDIKQTSDVVMTVRSIWANKVLSPSISSQKPNKRDSSKLLQSSTSDTFKSPPKKLMKIDDYFKTITSNLLKDLYGQEFNITQSNNKLIPVQVKKDENLVNCPICDIQVRNNEINRHLDECLNNDLIDNISTNNIDNSVIPSNNSIQKNKTQQDNIVIDLTNIPLETSMNETSMTKTNINKINIIEDNDTFEDIRSFDNIILDTKPEKVLSASVKVEHNCPCCGMVTESTEAHLDECLAFFDNNTTIPEEGPSTSFDDSEDINDESLILNATGTMSPCPCCMKMVEMTDMNDHLDTCLGSSFSENFDDT